MQLTVTETLTEKQCGSCGIWFAVPDWFEQECLEHGPEKAWTCPNGHTRHYRMGKKQESELRQMKNQLDAKEAQLRHERDQREATERSLIAQKGVNTRLKKRIGNGVCPHCQRHFKNVESHMKSQHPECV